ncbi:MAG: hypothetical protein DVB25_00475 [Verrucomicrobia bacterium]|nr:MAG: hypothetical protein DVB25_00475 [Verrucomicrobiota bacterium]
MKITTCALLAQFLAVSMPLFAGTSDWDPSTSPTLRSEQPQDLLIHGRAFELYQHGVRTQWGYQKPQQDIFVVVHPKNERNNAPLYVVLHSAGHDVLSALKCTSDVGNHDIYRSPDDFYALYLDCRANMGDWWWGGMHLGDAELTKRNSGADPMPVEKRVLDSIHWVMAKYHIDPNRVYLAGNSMGGSGTLGIGLRNGDLFAAIKANVPAGIEHVSNRMYFSQGVSANVALPDPPVVVDYSAQNDGWSAGHDRFAKAMNVRKYSFYLYWGPFGHANNSYDIEKTNDLINSFDWLGVRKNEAYAVFTNASCNDKLPWPDDMGSKAAGQINAFFRWKCLADTKDKLEMSLFLLAPGDLKTSFQIPRQATADVSLRRIQKGQIKPDGAFRWTCGSAKGAGKADANGLITISGVTITSVPTKLTVIITG